MGITLLYLDGCPCAASAEERVRTALDRAGVTDVEFRRVLVETPEDAARWRFAGSPTILVDGADPFASGTETPALACRVYETPFGRSGSPTVEQFVDVFAQR